MTIHITPEPDFSYVSFETNIPQKSYKELIKRIISTFGPKQFVLTYFCSTVSHMLHAVGGPNAKLRLTIIDKFR